MDIEENVFQEDSLDEPLDGEDVGSAGNPEELEVNQTMVRKSAAHRTIAPKYEDPNILKTKKYKKSKKLDLYQEKQCFNDGDGFSLTISEYEDIAQRLDESMKQLETVRDALSTKENLIKLREKVD